MSPTSSLSPLRISTPVSCQLLFARTKIVHHVRTVGVGTGVFVVVSVAFRVTNNNGVTEAVAVVTDVCTGFVAVGRDVGVRVTVGRGVCVRVGSRVDVAVAEGTGVALAVADGASDGVSVGVDVAVSLGAGVGVTGSAARAADCPAVARAAGVVACIVGVMVEGVGSTATGAPGASFDCAKSSHPIPTARITPSAPTSQPSWRLLAMP